MWTLLLVMVTIGVPALSQSAPVKGQSSRCSFAGVLHVEATTNYSFTFQKALELCQSLRYNLATQKQVIEAYEKGLRTCRYGWIDGQKVTFVPNINSLNCDSSSTEVTFRSEAAEYLSDVYCFNPSDSFDLNCEEAVKLEIFSSENQIPIAKTNNDIIEEALIEGFLIDLEKKTENMQENVAEKVIVSDEPMAKTDTEDTTGPKYKFRFRRSSVVGSLLPFDAEGSGSGSYPKKLFKPPEPQFTTTLPTTVTTMTNTSVIIDDVIEEKEAPKQNADTNVSKENESGSDPGILFNTPEPQFTTTSPTTETTKTKIFNDIIKEKEAPKQNIDTNAFKEKQGRMLNFDQPPTSSNHHGKGSPSWLVILATCVVVGAILCVFAAIATKDKWYGPKRSKNITPENYSKAGTLPLSEKEQEIVTLMNISNINDKKGDINAPSLNEHEKEYLM